MKTLNDYTIFCTPEQTRKALELGAPLNQVIEDFNAVPTYNAGKRKYYEIPFAEQMIGWIEEQDKIAYIDVYLNGKRKWDYVVTPLPDADLLILESDYPSRKEATLAAIDAALDYLTQKKK